MDCLSTYLVMMVMNEGEVEASTNHVEWWEPQAFELNDLHSTPTTKESTRTDIFEGNY